MLGRYIRLECSISYYLVSFVLILAPQLAPQIPRSLCARDGTLGGVYRQIRIHCIRPAGPNRANDRALARVGRFGYSDSGIAVTRQESHNRHVSSLRVL